MQPPQSHLPSHSLSQDEPVELATDVGGGDHRAGTKKGGRPPQPPALEVRRIGPDEDLPPRQSLEITPPNLR
jgi:hypothetical protein